MVYFEDLSVNIVQLVLERRQLLAAGLLGSYLLRIQCLKQNLRRDGLVGEQNGKDYKSF